MLRKPTLPVDDLVRYIARGEDGALGAALREWIRESPRFRAFVETYRDKIRKKARGARDEDVRADLTFELSVARRLLAERRFELEYEPYGVAQRAPDFGVTFRANLRLNVEVRRLRRGARAAASDADPSLVRIVCAKLGQLRPAAINVMVLGPTIDAGTLARSMPWLQERAKQRHDVSFRELGFGDSRDFRRNFRRVSAIFLVGNGSAEVWVNPQARHRMPADLRRALTAAWTT